MRLAVAGADGASRLVEFDGMPSDADLDEVAASFGASAAPAAASASSDPGLVGRLHDQLSGVETAVRALRANGGDPTAAYPKPLAHYLGAMQETADALQRAQAVPAPSPTPASSPSPTAPSTPPVDRGLVDRLHAQLANAEAGLRAWRDYKAKRGPMPTLDRGPNYYAGVMAETTAALQRAQSTTSQGASDDAPSNSTSLLLNPAGTKAPPAPRGRVRDVPLGSVPPPQDPAVASVADLVRGPLGFIQRAMEPGDGTGVLAPDRPQAIAQRQARHRANQVTNLQGLDFDAAGLLQAIRRGTDVRTRLADPKKTALANESLGLFASQADRDAQAAAQADPWRDVPLDGALVQAAHALGWGGDSAQAVRQLKNPKSDLYRQLVGAIKGGGGQSSLPPSLGAQALDQGDGLMASAIARGDPSIGDANGWGLTTRALGRANALGVYRTVTGDARPDSQVTPAEHAIGMVADLLSTAGMGSVGAAVAEAAPVAAMRSLVGRGAAKLVPDVVAGAGTRLAQTTVARAAAQGLERIASSVPGRIGSKIVTTVGENQAFAVPTAVAQAGDLTARGNGKGFFENLGDTAAEGAAGVLRSFDPTTILDPGAAPEARMQAALNLGLVMFGAGLEGYGWAASRAREAGMDPRLVQELLDKGRQEAIRRGANQIDRLTPADTTLSPAPMGRESQRNPGGYLDDPNARTSGEAPALVGGDSDPTTPPTTTLPNGESLVRDAADRTRLQAMREEFGDVGGLNRFVDERLGETKAVPPIVTGDEVTPAERKAMQTRLDRLRADRAALDEAPTIPADVRGSLIRSVDPDSEMLDSFSDRYDDGLATTLHRALFGEPPSRDAQGDVSDAALSRVRDELRSEQTAAYERETRAQAVANPEDAERLRALGEASRALRDPETRKDDVPDVDERDAPPSPEDWVSARRANDRRTIDMVGLEGVHPETARALLEYALSRESDRHFLRRAEADRFDRAGTKPNFRLLSEHIEKEVGSDWRRGDFEDWHRIALPRSVVGEYVRGRMAEMGTAREVLEGIAPTLSEREIQDVIEHAARGGEFPAERESRGDDRASHAGGPDALAGGAAEGDRRGGRPKSPRQGERDRLNRELAAQQARIDRARVVDPGKTPRIAQLGEPEPLKPGEKPDPLLRADGERADGQPGVDKTNRGRKANRNRQLVVPDPAAAAAVRAGDPALRAYALLDRDDPAVREVARRAARNPVSGELRWRNELDYEKVRDSAVAWMKKRQGKPMPVPALGAEVRFSGESIKKLKGNDVTSQRMVTMLPGLLRHAELVHNTEPRDLAKTGMTGTWLVARLETVLDGNYDVFMFVRRMHNGDFQYDHGYEEVVKKWPASKTSGVRSADESASTTDQPAQAPHSTPSEPEVSTEAAGDPA